MLKCIFFSAILLVSSMALRAQTQTQMPAHIGIIYPISTNGVHAGKVSNRFSLHAIAGLSRGERGVALAGFALVVRDSATGLQASGFLNRIGSAHGVQLAGFANSTGTQHGFCAAGFANISRDSADGQVAGFINKAREARFQAAGFINIARKVRGVQLAGLINIADTSDCPIGLINIVRNGERSVSLSTDETLTSLISFRSGGRKLYGIIGGGYNGKTGKTLYAWEAGLGAHFYIGSAFRINTEIATIGLTDFKNGLSSRQTLRVLPAVHLSRHTEFFVGPTFNHVDSRQAIDGGLVTHYIWSRNESNQRTQGLFFGGIAGLNILL